MALQSSASGADPLKLSEIKTEFGGAATPKLTDYLRDGSYVPNITPNVGVDSSLPINMLSLLSGTAVKNEYTMTVGSSGGYYGYSGGSHGSLAVVKNTLSPWGFFSTMQYYTNTSQVSMVLNSGTTRLSKGAFTTMEVVPGRVLTSASSTFTDGAYLGVWLSTWTWSTTNVFGTTAGATRKIYFY